MSLHDDIMHIRCDAGNVAAGFDASTLTQDQRVHYKLGHRDARHAAADLALKADAEIEQLRAGHDRYETVRRMTPQQFQAAFELNLTTGKPFDEIVDDLRPFMRPAAPQENPR